MLTLTRRVGESVCIGDDIKIVIKEIKGKQVRIGIIAPPDVYVCREELYLKIQSANMMAKSPDVEVLDSLSGLFGAAGAPRDAKAPMAGQVGAPDEGGEPDAD